MRAALVAVALLVAVAALVAGAADPLSGPQLALGAEPTLTPTELLETGDPRSEGEGPGLVGNPLLILVAVVALGIATAAATLAIARIARRA